MEETLTVISNGKNTTLDRASIIWFWRVRQPYNLKLLEVEIAGAALFAGWATGAGLTPTHRACGHALRQRPQHREGALPLISLPIDVAVLIALGTSLMFASGLILYAMIGKVNRKLPEDKQIAYLGFYPAKAFKITREYRRLYPRSHLNSVRIALAVIGFALEVAAAARLSHFLQ